MFFVPQKLLWLLGIAFVWFLGSLTRFRRRIVFLITKVIKKVRFKLLAGGHNRVTVRKVDLFLQRLKAQGVLKVAEDAVTIFPRHFELFGHVVVVKLNRGVSRDVLLPCARAFAESFLPRVVDVVLLDIKGIVGELREPDLEILWLSDSAQLTSSGYFVEGATEHLIEKQNFSLEDSELLSRCSRSPTFTTHIENGILYSFDVCKVMFCSGNVTERIHFSSINARDEVVVDMFAGIGYFTLPLAVYGGVRIIHALEKNKYSALFLALNAGQNKILSFEVYRSREETHSLKKQVKFVSGSTSGVRYTVMRSSEVQRDSILAAVVMECVKKTPSDTTYHSSALYQRLSAPETRNLVYQCCLELIEDSQRRRDIGQLLLNYVSSFPPSQAILQEIAEKCKPHALSRSPYSSIYQELKTMVETYLNHKPLGYMLGRTLQSGKEGLTFRQNGLSSNPDYIRKCDLQPLVVHSAEKSKHIFPLFGWSEEELTATAKEKNKGRSRLWSVKYHVVGCKDYVNQLPLECTEALIEQQVRVLNSFWEKYNTNPVVLRATSFLIKLMCDAYVSKIPLQSNYSFFRSVSICYLPTLFEMMGSSYACVRSHVYDILLTLGVHFQLVDTQGLFSGCTKALEEELAWVLLMVLKKQSLCEGNDEMIWTTAAKCVIALVPPRKHHLIDGRALYQLMKVSNIVTFHPHLYTTFAEAFSRRVLRWDPSGGDADEVVALDEEEFSACGHQPVAKLLFLYRQSVTLGARLAFFQVLFTYAVMVLQSRGKLPRLYPRSLRRCYSELVRVGFHWHLHSLLFYQSHQVFRELPKHITYDMDVKDMREYKAGAVAIVQCILQIVEENARLPDVIINAFRSAAEERDTLAKVVSDCVTIIPSMLKEDSDDVLYNIGWHMAVYCMRLSRENLTSGDSVILLEKLATNLVSFSGVKDRLELAKIKRACPDILAALMFLSRKHANQAVEPFSMLIEKFLHDTTVVDSQSVMQLYYRLFGSLTIQNGPFKGAQHADISQMLCSEQLVTAQPIVDSIGPRVLLALYRSLSTVQMVSACRARHVLASFLEEPVTCGGNSHSYSWKTIMDDPYPPVALTGAQRILQMCGRTAYDRFDEAMNTPQRSEKCDSVYALALKVIQLGESRKE